MENPRREKPRLEEKNNPLCQKLVQNESVSSDYDINPLKPIHHPIYMREKINKVGKKFVIFSSTYVSHREDFGLDQKRKSGHQALTISILTQIPM